MYDNISCTDISTYTPLRAISFTINITVSLCSSISRHNFSISKSVRSDLTSARFVGGWGEGWINPPLLMPLTPSLYWPPRKNNKNTSKIHCWPPSGFPTNRVLDLTLGSSEIQYERKSGSEPPTYQYSVLSDLFHPEHVVDGDPFHERKPSQVRHHKRVHEQPELGKSELVCCWSGSEFKGWRWEIRKNTSLESRTNFTRVTIIPAQL